MAILFEPASALSSKQMAKEAREDTIPLLEKIFPEKGEEIFNMLSQAHGENGD